MKLYFKDKPNDRRRVWINIDSLNVTKTLGDDWREATRLEYARDYLTRPRFSWIGFMVIVVFVSVIRAYFS